MTTWSNQDQQADASSITYGEAGITYGQINTQYNGKTRSTWSNQAES